MEQKQQRPSQSPPVRRRTHLMDGTDFSHPPHDFPLQYPSVLTTTGTSSTTSWLRGGPALDEIRSTFSSLAARKRKRSAARQVRPQYYRDHNTSSSGSDEGYNGSVSENERTTSAESSSSSDDDDDNDSDEKQSPSEPRVWLRKRRLVPPYSEIDDFGSEYCSDELFLSSSEEDKKLPARSTTRTKKGSPSILLVGGDVMAHVLTFLEPPNILQVLTAPLCKTWTMNFTRNSELWRVLCLTDPFKATDVEPDVDHRLLYTSFVRCLRYLMRMTEDSRNGRPLTIPQQSQVHENFLIASNRNLHRFLSRARQAVTSSSAPPASPEDFAMTKMKHPRKKKKTKSATTLSTPAVKYGHSMLTQKLLGPSSQGVAGQVELPWSCAIYSIVNWMVGFRNVEGIQSLCLKALPVLLEDEQQRRTAQQASLTELVLRAMVAFPDSAQLHAAAFHTIVLLARPMGGREGMLFHSTLIDSNGIFSSPEEGAANGKSGIAVLLDSMRRFLPDQTLQAMGCWSMVNLALVPAQKDVLIKLGAIDVALEAMVRHDTNEEVQFRALFAMINLIIPAEGTEAETEVEEPSNYDDIDADRIVDLVVTSMKNFYSVNSILNRACLVLHNLSLNAHFHAAMLWSPRCYQMLEWCLTNYRSDPVLYQGALRTLHRLQLTLSSNEALRRRFLSVLRTEQQKSLQLVQQEALREHDEAVAAVVSQQGDTAS